MESVCLIAPVINELRREGGSELAERALVYNSERRPWGKPLPPNARSIEQIAGVGLALLEQAKLEDTQGERRSIPDLAWDYGIERGSRQYGNDAFGKYIVPFLDYIEQRLPAPEPSKRSRVQSVSPPSIIQDSLRRFRAEHRDANSTCFVMMRFGKTNAHSRLEKTIKKTMEKHSLVAVLARDKEFHDDLYPNIQTYIHGCGFGIAVFERLETDEFNPNVALEVGYMFGLRKQVLLLKDKTLRALHTDLVGKLYREFDPQNPEDSIPPQIDAWLSDKGRA